LSQQDAEEIVEGRGIEALAKAERREERLRTGGGGPGSRRCGRCGEAGNNKRTCKKDTVGRVD
jgi:hypothetical protein